MQTPGLHPWGCSSAESKRLRACSFLPSFQVSLAPRFCGPHAETQRPRGDRSEQTGVGLEDFPEEESFAWALTFVPAGIVHLNSSPD